MRALVSLFTVVPVNSSIADFEDLSRRFWLLPVIGAFFGIVASLSLMVFSELFSLLLSAVLTVLILEAINRFLHFDGLMDLGDGLVAHGDQEKKLGAMKDSSIGAGGVAFALFFTLLSIVAYASLPSHRHFSVLLLAPFAAEVLSRHSMLVCTALGRPRPGLGSTFVANTNYRAILPSLILSIILVMSAWTLLLLQTGAEGIFYLGAALISVLLVIVSSLIGIIIASVAIRSFGCVNGDVIGATNEIARPLLLMAIILVVVL